MALKEECGQCAPAPTTVRWCHVQAGDGLRQRVEGALVVPLFYWGWEESTSGVRVDPHLGTAETDA